MENPTYPIPPEKNPPENQQSENSDNKTLMTVLIIIIVVLLLIATALAGYFLYYSTKNNTPNNNANINTNTNQEQNNASDLSVSWNQPRPIDSLNIFTSSDFNPEKEAKYFKVGTINNGLYKNGEIILVSASINSPALYNGFYRFIKTDNKLVLLAKYSDSTQSESGLDLTKFTIDENFVIPQMDFPENISELNSNATLELYPYINAFFSLNNLNKAFTNSLLGDVYVSDAVYNPTNTDLFKKNGFYIQAPDGTVKVYNLKIYFLSNNNAPAITWLDGAENKTDYTYTDQGGCGSINFTSVIPEIMASNKDLKVAGHTSSGDNIYEFTDNNHYLLKDLYDNKYQVMPGQSKISYQEFLDNHPIFFWRDPFGRLIKFENSQYGPLAECGKPVIYLYPTDAQVISVKVEPKGGMTYSDPAYMGGWNVWATPNGELTQLSSHKKYPYLFWEGKGDIYSQPHKGFVIKQSDVHNFLIKKLSLLGLNDKEIADFIEFWEPKMQGSPYYFVTFLGNDQMNQLAPLTINPRPDTVIRVLMDFSPLSQSTSVEGYDIVTPIRTGFTVVEWGGVLR